MRGDVRGFQCGVRDGRWGKGAHGALDGAGGEDAGVEGGADDYADTLSLAAIQLRRENLLRRQCVPEGRAICPVVSARDG